MHFECGWLCSEKPDEPSQVFLEKAMVCLAVGVISPVSVIGIIGLEQRLSAPRMGYWLTLLQ